jgi:hypothetical protein
MAGVNTGGIHVRSYEVGDSIIFVHSSHLPISHLRPLKCALTHPISCYMRISKKEVKNGMETLIIYGRV